MDPSMSKMVIIIYMLDKNRDMWDVEYVQEGGLMRNRDGVAKETGFVQMAKYQSIILSKTYNLDRNRSIYIKSTVQ